MDSFRWIAIVLAMILGLGLTRLLSALVAMFRSRTRAKLDWIPLAWAACIFIWQLQFWWALVELPGLVRVWTVGYFLTLVLLTLLLFVAAALVLPPDELQDHETLQTSFERDGRWSLLALSAYFLLAAVVDWAFWRVSPFSRGGALLLPLMILPLVVLRFRSRRVQAIITLLYVLLSICAAAVLSPGSYA